MKPLMIGMIVCILVEGFLIYRDNHHVARPAVPFECTGGKDCDE
jgi:hypothetical protein